MQKKPEFTPAFSFCACLVFENIRELVKRAPLFSSSQRKLGSILLLLLLLLFLPLLQLSQGEEAKEQQQSSSAAKAKARAKWIPAFAGMTVQGWLLVRALLSLSPSHPASALGQQLVTQRFI